MSHWGSFSPKAYGDFLGKLENPTNYMVVAPALASRAASQPSSYFMNEDEDEYEDEEEWEDEYEDEDEEEFDTNASMAMGQLRSMAEDIMMILSELTDGEEIEPWVAAKITMSKQNLSSVADYLRFGRDY